MDWTMVLSLIASNLILVLTGLGVTVTLFLWARSEAREDRKNDEERWENHRREMMNILKAIQDESRDFHTRLCQIENRRKSG